MASELNMYTRINKIGNMDVVTDLADANPKNYAAVVTEGSRHMIDLPLKDIVKMFVEVPLAQ